MKKRLKKEYTVEDLVVHIKGKNYELALQGILDSCEHKERVKFVADAFINSKYKAFKAGMLRFELAITEYFGGNRDSFIKYCNDVDKEAKDTPNTINNSGFSYIRRSILLDAKVNKSAFSYQALMGLIYDINDIANYTSDDPRILSYVGRIASKKWPDNNGLMVLFG